MRIVMFLIHKVKVPGAIVIPYSEASNEQILLSKCENADIVFLQIQGSGWINAAVIKKIKAFTMVYSGDVRDSIENFQIELGQVADLMLFVSKDYIRRAEALNIKADFFNDNYDEEIFYPYETEKKHDIVFMGNDYAGFELSQYRKDVVAFLKENYGNKFLCLGRGWGENNDGNNHYDLNNQNKIYNESKIAINVSNLCQARYSSDRILRAMASGCFVLTHYFPEMPYKDGEHLRVFRTFDELIVLCEYYLVFEKEREQIAQAGTKYISKINRRDLVAKQIIKLYERNRTKSNAVRSKSGR